ncbi:MAG: efflux RND transporter permease subunit [Candidatus Zixiibacteriota bacterium]
MIAFIIKRPVLVGMLLIGLCLLGVISYNRLPVELLPYAELPMLFVQVGAAGDADPHYLEQQGVIPLENAIAGLEDIEQIESYIDSRRAMIIVTYTKNADQKYAYLKLQECVDNARADMGSDFFAMVLRIDTDQLSNQFMTLQARGEGSLDQIRNVIEDKVKNELENIDGIANVEVYGGQTRSIEILLDQDALNAHGLTTAQVRSTISGGRASRQYLGQAVEGRREFFVNLEADYTDIAHLEELVLKSEGPILLKHVAEIVDGTAEQETIARVNGQEAITITLMRDQQSNLIDLSHDTRDVVDRLNDEIASDGITLEVEYNAAEDIEKNINNIKELALIGGLLAIVVLWIFLRNFPLVIVIATAMPISILVAMNFFYAFDVTLNTLSLVGLAIAIGMLLDNSVVVLENIYRLRSRGQTPQDAVVNGAGEVWRAVFAATLTTVSVFLPFIFSDNFLIQNLGWHVGVSIISTLLVSLAVAFLLIPAFSYRILIGRFRQESTVFTQLPRYNRLMQIYTLFLKSCMRFPARTLIIGVTVFFLSVIICLAVSINAPQEVELESFSLYATMPSGTTLETADEQVIDMDARLNDIAEIQDRIANIQEDNIVFTFQLKEDYKDIADRDINTIKSEILDKLENAYERVDFSYEEPTSNSRFSGGGGGGGAGMGMGRSFMRMLGIGSDEEKVTLKGQNLAIMRSLADDIEYNLGRLESVSSTRLTVSDQNPGIDLNFDKPAISHFNVSTSAIMSELSAFQGEVSSGVVLKDGTDEVNIVLKDAAVSKTEEEEEKKNKNSDDLRDVLVPSNSGGTVPLLQLARMIYSSGYANITRINQEKQVDIIYHFNSDVTASSELLDAARAEVDLLISGLSIPSGVAVEVVHDETDLSEFYFLILASVLLIYMILASVFESLLTPLAMMFTLPLATIGAFWGLILTGNSIMDANALIGFLILLGVVVNNGIILIDYFRLLQSRGYNPGRALIMAGQARVRPILITALTTILAMVPLAMGKAEYVGQIGAPFAITVIGGMIAGTLFTLLLVPTVAFGMNQALHWWYRLGWKVKTAQLAAFTVGVYYIYNYVDGAIWKGVDLTALLIVIPGLTYFILTSLRRTSTTLIRPNESITITIRNVVKLYGDYSRFAKEWQAGKKIRERLVRFGIIQRQNRLISFACHLPLYGFLYYFAFLYVEAGFWEMLYPILFYAYTIWMARLIMVYDSETPLRFNRMRRIAFFLLYWILPLVIGYWFSTSWDGFVMPAIILAFWYLILAITTASRKLYREKIDINRLKGPFKWIRKTFYRFVRIIPFIGKKKRPFKALDQVSLEIGSGMFGLVGPNGAGKTTLMRIICGILEQTTGKVYINGIDLDEKREELQSLIGYLPQEFGTYENMTAYQFLDYLAILKGITDYDERRDIVEKSIKSVNLEDNRDVKIKAFSGGMKQRVGIAQTLSHLPRILVVDEPTAGLDPRQRIKFRNLLSELARDRIVIFSTHIIEDISSSCNRVAVLGGGRVKFLGSPRDMVELTRGKIWFMKVTEEQFEQMRKRMKIVHHMREGDEIRVRLIADSQPSAAAVEVTPTLEDSYLWLLEHKGEDA